MENVLTNESLPYDTTPMIDPEVYDSLALQFSLSQKRMDQASLDINKSRLAMGEELQMRQEVLLDMMTQQNAQKAAAIDSALSAGEADVATSIIQNSFEIEPRLVVEQAATQEATAIKQTDQPEFEYQKSEDQRTEETVYTERALALNNAFIGILSEFPSFEGGVVEDIRSVGKYAGMLPELFMPLAYGAMKADEGSLIRDTILPGSESAEESALLFEAGISDKEFMSRLDRLTNKARDAFISGRPEDRAGFGAANPLAAFSVLYEAAFTQKAGERSNPELDKYLAIKEFEIDGVKVPNILPEIYNTKNSVEVVKDPYTGEETTVERVPLDPILNNEWTQNALNLVDIVATAGTAKKGIVALSQIMGQRAGAQAAAKATTNALALNKGDPAIEYALQLRKDSLVVPSGIQEHIDQTNEIAQAGLGVRTQVVRTTPTGDQVEEFITGKLKPEYGKEVNSFKYFTRGADQFVEVLVGKKKDGSPFLTQLSAEKANAKYGNIYEVVDLSKQGGVGFALRAERSVDEHGWFKADFAERVSASDPKLLTVPGLRKLSNSFIGKYIFSPAVTSIQRSMFESVSSAFERGKMIKTVERMIEPVGKLSRGEQDNLADVINFGKKQPSRNSPDDLGRWFDYGELDRAYLKLHGRSVTDGEAKAYYSYKSVSDMAHSLANEAERSSILSWGGESWQLKNHSLPSVIGKKVQNRGAVFADARIMTPEGNIVLKSDIQDTLLADPNTDLIQVYGLADRNAEPFTHVLVSSKHDATTAGLQKEVIGYTEGGTRNYQNVWFAKQLHSGGAVDRRYAKNPVTHGIFESKQAAERYVSELNEATKVYKEYLRDAGNVGKGKLKKTTSAEVRGLADVKLANINDKFSTEWIEAEIDANRLNIDHPLEVVYDRERLTGQIGPNVERVMSYQRQGKLYYSERGDFLLEDGQPAKLANPYVALGNQISQVVHANAYKNFMIREVADWYANFGNPYLGYYKVPEVAFPSPDEVVRLGQWIGPNNPETQKIRNVAEAQRMYVKRVLGQPDAVDTWVHQFNSRVAQSIATVLGDKKWAHSAKYQALGTGRIVNEVGAVQKLKSFAFDASLGFFHLGQIILQGTAAASAVAFHPVYGLKSIMLYPALRAAALADSNSHVVRLLGKRLGKTLDFKDFNKMFSDYRKTGLHNVGATDTVLDRASVAVGTTSTAANIYDTVKAAGRVPLYEGERIGRMVAFGIAWQEAQELVKAGKLVDNSAEYIMTIQGLSNKYTLNMMSGMETAWQRNIITAIPTQFWQYPWKYAEVFLGLNREVTSAERARFVMGHMFLFGAHGVPFGPEIVNKLIGPAVEDISGDPLEKKEYLGLLEGPLSSILTELTGEPFAIGSTYGSGDFGSRLISDLFEDGAPLQMAGGVGLSVIQRAMSAGWNIANIWFSVNFHNDLLAQSFTATEQTMTELGQVVRSLGMANQAYYLHRYGVLLDTKGLPVEQNSSYSAFATMLGVKSQSQSLLWQAQESRKGREERLFEVAREVAKLHVQATFAARDGEEDKSNMLMRQAVGLAKGLTFADNQDMTRMVRSLEERDYSDYLYNNKESLPYDQRGE